MNSDQQLAPLACAQRLTSEVLEPMKAAFVGKDEIIDLLGVCLVGRENLFLLGPPGTAKSALIHDLASRLQGRTFDYLLTRFTEPNEIFGPFDIRRLREGELVTNKEGMLPEADLVFLDELLHANSAVLNSLLMALNERVFRRGREKFTIPMLMCVAASNSLPDDEALKALFDRFLVRVPCLNVAQEQLTEVLNKGWDLDRRQSRAETAIANVSIDDIRSAQQFVSEIDLSAVRPLFADLVQRLRHAGVAVSDRRAVKFQRLLAASAILCGRTAANASDFWILRYTWETEEQQQVLATLVANVIEQAGGRTAPAQHPRVRAEIAPDHEALARDFDRLEQRLIGTLSDADRSYVRDQLSVLRGRCEWVVSDEAREFLTQRGQQLWKSLEVSP